MEYLDPSSLTLDMFESWLEEQPEESGVNLEDSESLSKAIEKLKESNCWGEREQSLFNHIYI